MLPQGDDTLRREILHNLDTIHRIGAAKTSPPTSQSPNQATQRSKRKIAREQEERKWKTEGEVVDGLKRCPI